MEEKKRKSNYNQIMNKRTQAFIQANYDQVTIRMPKGKRNLYADALKEKGISMNKYVVQKLDELLEGRENGI